MLQRFRQKRVERDKEYLMKSPKFSFEGIFKASPPIKLSDSALFDARNVFIKEDMWTKRPGLAIFANGLPLPNPILQVEQFYKYDGTEYLVAFTTKDAYVYNVSTHYWDLITENLLLDDCETVWTPTKNAKTISDSSWNRYGLYSAKIASSVSLDAFNVPPLSTDVAEFDLECNFAIDGHGIASISAGDLRELNILPDVAILDSLNAPPLTQDISCDLEYLFAKGCFDASTIVAGDLRELDILPDVALLDNLNIPPLTIFSTDNDFATLEIPIATSGLDKAALSAEDIQNLQLLPIGATGSGFDTGVVAYHNISSKNLSTYTHIHFYIKSSLDIPAGDLQLLLDDTSACVSPLEALNIPALTADVPLEIEIPLANPSSDTAIVSVGLRVVNNKGACNIWLDDIRAVGCFSGSKSNRFSCETMYDNDSGEVKFLVTNGVDNIKFWNGTGNWADLAGTPPKCKFLKVFYTWLLLLNCTVSGDHIPQRIEWCVPGNPKDWSSSGWGTTTLSKSTGEIIGCEIIRGQLAILLENSIAMMYATGTTPPFTFDESKILSVGCKASGSIKSLGETIIFLGNENFYQFDGYACPPIGDAISISFFDNINPNCIDTIFSHLIKKYNLYLLFYPSVSSEVPDSVLIYDYIKNRFLGTWKFSTNITSEGFYRSSSGITIGGLTMTIGEMNFKIGSNVLQNITPYDLLGDEDGYTYTLTETAMNDNGVIIDSYFDTKSYMPNVGKYCRFVRQELYAIGTQIETLVSVDDGVNFVSKNISSLYTNRIMPKLTDPFDVTNEKIMYRFRNNEIDGWFKFTGFRHFYIEKTEEV